MSAAQVLQENQHVQWLCLHGFRPDGRSSSMTPRNISITPRDTPGQVEVCFGQARCLAMCVGEVVTPRENRKNDGFLKFQVNAGHSQKFTEVQLNQGFIDKSIQLSELVTQFFFCLSRGKYRISVY